MHCETYQDLAPDPAQNFVDPVRVENFVRLMGHGKPPNFISCDIHASGEVNWQGACRGHIRDIFRFIIERQKEKIEDDRKQNYGFIQEFRRENMLSGDDQDISMVFTPDRAFHASSFLDSCLYDAKTYFRHIYILRGRSFIRSAETIFSALGKVFLQEEDRGIPELEEEEIIRGIDSMSVTLQRHDISMFYDFLAISEELGKLYGYDKQFTAEQYRAAVSRREYIRQCRERLEAIENNPSRVRALSRIMLKRGEDENDDVSFFDIYVMYYGINLKQQQYDFAQIKQALGEEFLKAPSVVKFCEDFLKGKTDGVDCDDSGNLIVSPEIISRGRSHPELIIAATIDALNRKIRDLDTLRESKAAVAENREIREWKMRYRTLGVLEFDLFLLRRYRELLSAHGVVSDIRLGQLTKVLAGDKGGQDYEKSARYYLEQNYGFGIGLPNDVVFINRIKTLCGITSSDTLTRRKTSNYALTRQREYREDGLEVNDAITAYELKKAKEIGDFTRMSIGSSGLDFAFRFWNDCGGYGNLDQAGQKLKMINQTTMGRAGMVLVAGYLADLEDAEFEKAVMKYQYENPVLRRIKEGKKLEGKGPLEKFLILLPAVKTIRGLSAQYREYAQLAIEHTARHGFSFESAILGWLVSGNSALDIVKKCELLPNTEAVALSANIAETIKLLVRYPLVWAEISPE